MQIPTYVQYAEVFVWIIKVKLNQKSVKVSQNELSNKELLIIPIVALRELVAIKINGLLKLINWSERSPKSNESKAQQTPAK